MSKAIFHSAAAHPGSLETLTFSGAREPVSLEVAGTFLPPVLLSVGVGEGGGSSLGLVLLEILGLEHTESPSPVSATEPEKAKECKSELGAQQRKEAKPTQATSSSINM